MLFKSSNIPPFCQNSLVWFEAKKHKSTILLNVAHPYVNNIARDCISYGLSIIGWLQNIFYIVQIGCNRVNLELESTSDKTIGKGSI